ncbi:MAG: pentapeptide repeat-containing protein [Leptolyngbyaceae cyanobacterium]
MVRGWLWALAAVVMIGWGWLMLPMPSRAAELSTHPLTVTQLQDRIKHPVQRDGKPTIDLRRIVLDLRDENDEFRTQFYRLLQNRLQVGDTTFNLDLRESIIKGEFDLQRLSLREPLYGEAFLPLLTEQEQAQLRRDRRRLSQLSELSRSLLLQPQPTALRIYLFRNDLNLAQTRFEGPVLAADIFFLGPVNAQGVQFLKPVNFSESRFSQTVTLVAGQFQQAARFRSTLFFGRFRGSQANFAETVTFQGSEFAAGAGFGQTTFQQEANFSRVNFRDSADFGKTTWQGGGSFLKTTFAGDLFLTEARFAGPVSWRQSRFEQSANLRGAIVQSQLDFGDAAFGSETRLNVAGLDFNSDQGELLGSPGQIGQVLSVPNLAGNETLLRNLVRNFRELEQVADANRIEYLTERLRLRSLQQQLTSFNLNTASQQQLETVGFSAAQSQAIVARRQESPFVKAADVLDLAGIDLAAYVKARDRIIAQPPLSATKRLQLSLRWAALAALLLLSHYGTSVGLTLSVGLMAIALSSLLFWFVDRYRRRVPTPITPSREETLWMGGSFIIVIAVSALMLNRLGDTPGLTAIATFLLVLPIPLIITTLLYRQGRFHDQLDTSYLVEDGSLRQLRLLIARLPIIPKFPFFRDRYYAIDWQKRRNWLNYYDFSLNNWFKFGFNDLRLRDEDVPGLVTALVWYQWAIGLAYIALLLWTFSRTIPGLNLLLYF